MMNSIKTPRHLRALLAPLLVVFGAPGAHAIFAGDVASITNLGADGVKSGGIVWVDLNGDGRVDVIANGEDRSWLFIQSTDEAVFTDATGVVAGPLGQVPAREGLIAVDVNRDGVPDILRAGGARLETWIGFPAGPEGYRAGMATGSGLRPNTVLRAGACQPTLVDPPGARCQDVEDLAVQGLAWVDVDRDGWRDVVAAGGGTITLLRNPRDLAGAAPWEIVDQNVSHSFDGDVNGTVGGYISATDFDADGFVDLAAQLGDATDVWRNRGDGTFTPLSIPDFDGTGSGSVVFCDFDNDGDFDLFYGGHAGDESDSPRTLTSNQVFFYVAGAFVPSDSHAPVTGRRQPEGIVVSGESRGAACGDLDHDGDVDLVVTGLGRDVVYLNQLVEMGAPRLIEPFDGFGLVSSGDAGAVTLVDYDRDGDLDAYVAETRTNDLHRNALSAAAQDQYLMVEVGTWVGVCEPDDNTSVTPDYGALVKLFDAQGRLLGLREVNGGEGHGRQGTTQVHFGLGTGALTDTYTVEVTPQARGAATPAEARYEIAVIPAALGDYHLLRTRPNDRDGDGIPDAVERADTERIDPERYDDVEDIDGDGFVNWEDGDSDGDGVPDGVEEGDGRYCTPAVDTDEDGVPDYLDPPDTDGDGLDLFQEALHETNPEAADTDGDGLDDGDEVLVYGTNPRDKDTDDDGLSDGDEAAGTGPLSAFGETSPTAADTDGDGLSDGLEVGVTAPIPDNIFGLWPSAGTDTASPDWRADGDGDSATDPNLADTDDDGLDDGEEDVGQDGVTTYTLGGVGTQGSGETDPGLEDTDGDGLSDGDEVNIHKTDPLDVDTDDGGVLDGAEVAAGADPLNAADDAPADTDNDGILDFVEVALGLDPNNPDEDDDGVLDGDDDLDGDGIPTGIEARGGVGVGVPDTDGDGTPDARDTDSDNDGLSDLVEGQLDLDRDGVGNWRDDDDDGDGILTRVERLAFADVDRDGIPNWRDRDSDGDGSPDGPAGTGEGEADADNDGLPNYLDPDDGDGADADYDGDGIRNAAEVSFGTLPMHADSDGDGRDDGLERGKGTFAADTDDDGLHDAIDPDDDGDGVPSWIENYWEAQAPDLDGDGVIAALDDDSDGDGLLDAAEGLRDVDGDGIPAFYDLDSDGDGVSDEEEGMRDQDGDGVPNAQDPDDTDGPNFDGDADGVRNGDESALGTDAYIADSDGDGFSDGEELGDDLTAPDLDMDGLIDALDTDDDNDTVPTALEGKDGRPGPDADGDGVPDVVEGVTDLDGDGIPNHLDGDADGDGTPDGTERFGDIDLDGVVNAIDPDDDDGPDADPDGDGLTSLDEARIGSPAYDPDADDDSLLDGDEIGARDNPRDTDGDGLIDWQDPDDDGDGILTAREVADTAAFGDIDGDKDGAPAWLDEDSDGDTVPDAVEGTGDIDGDGIPNYLDADDESDIGVKLAGGQGCAAVGGGGIPWAPALLVLLGLVALRRRRAAAPN